MASSPCCGDDRNPTVIRGMAAMIGPRLGISSPTAADAELVIEVSDSTYTHDHDHKLPAYFAAGCRRVWLINISDHAHPVLEVYTDPDRPAECLHDGQVSILGGPSDVQIAAVNLDELFAGVPELPTDEYSERP
jgi:hypothetical protein